MHLRIHRDPDTMTTTTGSDRVYRLLGESQTVKVLGCKVDLESFEALDITIACNSLPKLKVKVNLGVKVEFTQHMSDAQYDLLNLCLYI